MALNLYACSCFTGRSHSMMHLAAHAVAQTRIPGTLDTTTGGGTATLTSERCSAAKSSGHGLHTTACTRVLGSSKELLRLWETEARCIRRCGLSTSGHLEQSDTIVPHAISGVYAGPPFAYRRTCFKKMISCLSTGCNPYWRSQRLREARCVAFASSSPAGPTGPFVFPTAQLQG